MEEHPICPHCGRGLDENIPLALEGTIQLKCPFCEMTYSFQRQKDSSYVEEDAEYYLSAGPFRRKLVLGDNDEPRKTDPTSKKYSCLFLCLFGPLILLGIYLLIMNLIVILSQL